METPRIYGNTQETPRGINPGEGFEKCNFVGQTYQIFNNLWGKNESIPPYRGLAPSALDSCTVASSFPGV